MLTNLANLNDPIKNFKASLKWPHTEFLCTIKVI